MNAFNNFLFLALPYAAMILFIVGTVYRYRVTKFKVSSLSSQFLEGRKLFFGSIPFHWGIVTIFFGHLIALLIPRAVLIWNGDPLRLVILEVTAFVFGISLLIGLILLIYRRWTNPRIRVVTNKMDIFIELLLLAQVILGLWVALDFRWGSNWFAAVITPYLWSIFTFSPEAGAVIALPWVVKLHIIGAYLIVAFIPFSRLMHVLVPPINYLWRSYQLVRWNWDRKEVRKPSRGWNVKEPKNN